MDNHNDRTAPPKTLAETCANFEARELCISACARDNGFSANLIFNFLDGRKNDQGLISLTFKTLCRAASIDEEVSDALTGHAPISVGRSYGEMPLSRTIPAIRSLVFLIEFPLVQE
ncbi:hypothetical protein [Propionivibrio sp.]|uniref:hypothetical protein n=1 Tax=Propionivibrio sp. TaxID=2212460 RepID=UPI003BEFE956